MSNSLGNDLVRYVVCRPSVTEIQNRFHPQVSGSSLYGVPPGLKADHTVRHRKNSLSATKTRISQGTRRTSTMAPRAVLTADPAPELAGKFNLDANSELQIIIHAPTPGSLTQIEFQVSNINNSLVLHWGAICQRKRDWTLPSRRPDGTKAYKKKALRTPFANSGSNSSLKIEIDDPEILAIEFLILDEAQNKWFKNNGQNFQVQLSGKGHQNMNVPISENPNVLLPEDLVQIQAYLRWERKGRQTYTPVQETASLNIFFVCESCEEFLIIIHFIHTWQLLNKVYLCGICMLKLFRNIQLFEARIANFNFSFLHRASTKINDAINLIIFVHTWL